VVNLTRIYTRGGDAGETSLGDGRRVSKASARIAAYGTVDELNAHIGVLRTLELPDGWDAWLARIQNELFDLGADLCVPEEVRPDRSSERERTRLRVDASQVAWLEARCDELNDRLPPLTSFILPGGTPAAAQLHVCRTVCRRAERAAIVCGEELGEEVVRYLNRLSDLLFILARAATPPGAEPLWQPGASRPE
jgi:cob(I)alamin adenosyltransferase